MSKRLRIGFKFNEIQSRETRAYNQGEICDKSNLTVAWQNRTEFNFKCEPVVEIREAKIESISSEV